MPEIVFSILGAMVLIGEASNNHRIAECPGYEMGSFNRYTGTLKRLGWIEKQAGLLTITERGKIVHAIEVGKRTKLRGQRHYKPLSSKEFDRLNANWRQEAA